MRSLFQKLQKFQKARWPHCTALVAAAGNSSRMGGIDKLMQLLDGVPVLVWTLQALQRAERVDEIIIAVREELLIEISQLCKTYGISKCTKIIRGGESRVHTVLLAALEAGRDTQFFAVQDGARPLVTPDLIDAVVLKGSQTGAAAPAISLRDTIKIVGPDHIVLETPDRELLRAVQTPQVFEAGLLKAALQSALQENIPITDDCSAVERLGKQVCLIPGEEENLKITTPTDLILAEALLANRKQEG